MNTGFQTPLFEDLTGEELRGLFANRRISACRKGQVIFYEGAAPASLYFVIRGKAKVCKQGLWNQEQIVRLAGPGDLLTLRAAGGVSHYVVSATALEDSEILSIDLEDFFRVLRSNALFACRVVSLLARELDQSENRIRDFAQKNVRQRLADLLLSLNAAFGGANPDSLGVRLSRRELANCIGTSCETAVRLLADFRDKGCLALEGREILICDRKRLESAARPDRVRPLYPVETRDAESA